MLDICYAFNFVLVEAELGCHQRGDKVHAAFAQQQHQLLVIWPEELGQRLARAREHGALGLMEGLHLLGRLAVEYHGRWQVARCEIGNPLHRARFVQVQLRVRAWHKLILELTHKE